jgi:hypothetical protein
MKQYMIIPIFLFVLYSCGNEPRSPGVSAVVQNEQPTLPISDYIKKFKIIQQPFYYLGWAQNERYLKQSFVLKHNSIDTMFYNLPADLPVYGYGMLADTSSFYSLIYFETADDNYPVLVTYSKSGQQLSKEGLIVHGCGSDCGLKYCSYTAQIDKNFSIYMADTVHYEGMCDSADKYTPVDSTFIYSKTGAVDKSGIIKLSEEVEQRKGKVPPATATE